MSSPRLHPLVRRLRGSRDFATYGHFLLALDAETRRQRFAGHLSDTAILRHVARLGAGDAMLFGAFADGRMIGAAEIVPLPRSDVAEAGFVVAPDRQRQGVGGALLDRAVLAAANRGISRLEVVAEPSNLPMRRLARRAGGSVDLVAGIPTGKPSLFGIWAEALSDLVARQAKLDRQS